MKPVPPEEISLPDWYNDDYLFFSKASTPPENIENETEFIWQMLGLKPGSRVLDFGCGFGRIANKLAQRGASVTGVEAVPLLLDQARMDAKAAGLAVDYRLGQMREFVCAEKFDSVLMWFYTFGYHDDAGNMEVLAAAASALKPGGVLLFDQYNTPLLANTAIANPYSLIDLGNSLLIQRSIADLERGRWGAERIAVRDGQIRRSRFTCRSYSPPELKDMLPRAGFETAKFWGDGFLPLSVESIRMIVLARKEQNPRAENRPVDTSRPNS
jgi:SAM-dependent methyltransferase